MQIKPILVRLQSALGRNDLVEQMVLLPESAKASKKAKANKTVKLVVGYNGSHNSQTALDMTLWIAHQTRLATQKQVVVHVVYVVEPNDLASPADTLLPHVQLFDAATGMTTPQPVDRVEEIQFSVKEATRTVEQFRSPEAVSTSRSTAVLSRSQPIPVLPSMSGAECVIPSFQPTSSLDHADYVLWQARCLAEEWRGSLEAHLRFGSVAKELRNVVEAEAADLLLLGCHTASHSLVKRLVGRFPCAVLGIPTQVHPEEPSLYIH